MRKTILLLTFAITLLQQGYSQSIRQVLKVADSTYAQKDFYVAFIAYQDALKFDTNRTDIRFKIAESARQFNSYRIAAQNYVKVLGSSDKAQYPEARLRMAEMLHKLGEYKSALSSYQEYLQTNPQAAPEFAQMARKGIADCDFAVKTLANTAGQVRSPLAYSPPVTLGDKTNSPYTDYGAFFRKDTLYHTAYEFAEPKDKNTLFNKVVRSYQGTPKELLPASFNAPGKHTAYSVFTQDDKGVYFCNCDPINAFDLRCDIYYRDLTMPEKAPIKLGINLPQYTSTSPALGKNTQGRPVLYFVSNRTGGKGKLDIWMGPIQADGNVTSAEPVAELNTPGNDITPFFHEISGRPPLFFFSTDGRPTFGGYDVYGTRLTNNRWFTPFNLGAGLNTSYDEIGYVRNPQGDTAVFSSNRIGSILLAKEQEACCHDLFKMGVPKLVNLEVNTFKLRDSLALNGTTVSIFEEAPDGTRKEILNKTEVDTNYYATIIERHKKYYIRAQKKGFITKDSLITADLGEEQTTLVVDLFLPNLRLDVFTLLAVQETPLNGCTVTIYEKNASGQFTLLETKSDPNGNEYNYLVDLGKTYLVKATKLGFSVDSLEVPMNDETVKQFGYDVTVDLFLAQVKLAINLFFDNAKPGPNPQITTSESYLNLYNTYIQQEEKFLGFSGQIMRSFFQNTVKRGYDSLELVLPGIVKDLEKGMYVKVYMAGFASPLGNADYNKKLGYRRMESVINYFKQFENGVMKKYISSGHLTFDKDAVGEDQSGPDIPTALANVKNEIFGIKPSLDRKVQIYRIITDTKQPK